MNAVFSTVQSGFTLPTATLGQFHLRQQQQQQSTGSAAAAAASSGWGYLEQVAFLKRVASSAFNSEYVSGKSGTDPGHCVVRYPPITIRRGSDDSTAVRAKGVTVQISSTGAVSVVSSRVDVATALAITHAVKEDLMKALAGKGPRGLLAEEEERALLRHALGPSYSSDSDLILLLSVAAEAALDGRQWRGLAVLDASVRSYTAYLYPAVAELLLLRRDCLLNQRRPCGGDLRSLKRRRGTHSDGDHDDDDDANNAPMNYTRHASSSSSVTAAAAGGSGGSGGKVRVNVRGDAGVQWLDLFLSDLSGGSGSGAAPSEEDRQSTEAYDRRIAEQLCAAAATISQVKSGATAAEGMAAYLAERRAALRRHVSAVNVSRIASRGGIQLAMQWAVDAAPPRRKHASPPPTVATRPPTAVPVAVPRPAAKAPPSLFNTVFAGPEGLFSQCSIFPPGPGGTNTSTALEQRQQQAPVFSMSSAEFFFMESTMSPFAADATRWPGAAPRAGSGLPQTTGQTLGAFLSGNSNTTGPPQQRQQQVKPAVQPTPTAAAGSTPESVNCIVYASGTVQFACCSIDALHQVVRLILLPLLVCTADIRK